LLLEGISNLLEGVTLSLANRTLTHRKIDFGTIAAVAADLRQYVEGASVACRHKVK